MFLERTNVIHLSYKRPTHVIHRSYTRHTMGIRVGSQVPLGFQITENAYLNGACALSSTLISFSHHQNKHQTKKEMHKALTKHNAAGTKGYGRKASKSDAMAAISGLLNAELPDWIGIRVPADDSTTCWLKFDPERIRPNTCMSLVFCRTISKRFMPDGRDDYDDEDDEEAKKAMRQSWTELCLHIQGDNRPLRVNGGYNFDIGSDYDREGVLEYINRYDYIFGVFYGVEGTNGFSQIFSNGSLPDADEEMWNVIRRQGAIESPDLYDRLIRSVDEYNFRKIVKAKDDAVNEIRLALDFIAESNPDLMIRLREEMENYVKKRPREITDAVEEPEGKALKID